MTPQQLKNSILQWAIEGRLVEQRPEEGTAMELLKEIQAEKAQLVKEGKIKKSKALPPITEEEKPFDIPNGWEWVRWGDLSHSIQYGYNAPAQTKGRIKMVRISDIQDNRVLWDTVPYCQIDEENIKTYALQPNDILFARTGGTVGKSYLVTEVPEEAIYAGYLIRTRYSNLLVPQYLKVFMESPIYWEQLRNGTIATAQPNCNGKTLGNMILPLPPLAEQCRIVAKIEELLPLIDKYGKAYTKLTDFNTRFPDAMKKSLLQYAIQGKLVEQCADEGTAQDLIKDIQAEKKRLIAEKKIKKPKALPPITEEEIPFDIPESWEWVRLGDLFLMQAGKNIKAACISDSYDEQHKYLCYGGNGVRGYVENYNREGSFPIIGRQGALCGNIHLAEGKFYATEHAVVTETFAGTNVIWAKYFLIALNLNQYATATAQPGLAVNKVETVLIPLPPLAEQHRIVAKLEELLPFCDQLNK